MRLNIGLVILASALLIVSVNGKTIGQDKCCGEDLSGCCKDGSECCMIYNRSLKNYDIGCCGLGEACCDSNKCCKVNQTCCGTGCCSNECYFNFVCVSTFGLEKNVFLGIAAGIVVIILLALVLIIACSCRACHNRSKKRKEAGDHIGLIEMDKKEDKRNSKNKVTDSDSFGGSEIQGSRSQMVPNTFVSTASIIKQVSRNFTEDDKATFIQNCQNIKPFICGIIRLYVFEKIDLDEYATLVATAYASTILRPLTGAHVNACIEIIENSYTTLVMEGGGNKDAMVPAGLDMLKVMLKSSSCESFSEALNLLHAVVERTVDNLGNDTTGDSECIIEYCIGSALLNFNDQSGSDPSTLVDEFKTWIEPICSNSCVNSGCLISDYSDRNAKYEEMFKAGIELLTSLTEKSI